MVALTLTPGLARADAAIRRVTLRELRVFPVPAFYTQGASPFQDTLDAARDVLTLPEEDRCFVRYLSLYNLPNPGRVGGPAAILALAERQAFADHVLRLHLNLLSRQPEFAFGAWITPTLLRIDLRDFGLDAKVWDKSADIDPYFHFVKDVEYGHYEEPGHKWTTTRTEHKVTLAPWLPGVPAAVLVEWTQSRSPILRADWFFVATSRQFSLRNDEKNGFGYYDLLGIKSRKDWFDLVRLDEKLAIRAYKEVRSVVDKSKVSAQNRQGVRLQSLNGGVHGTLDVFDESGHGIAKQNLKRNEFQHDAEEWFGPLDNGLPATLAAAADGTLQSVAPDKIGPNDSPRRKGRDGRIHVNLACMQCHSSPDVLQPITDWVRTTYVGEYKLGSKDKQTDLLLKRLYFSDLQGRLKADNEEYARAIWRCVRLTPARISDLYSSAFYRYALEDVGLDRGSEELGVSREHFLGALRVANDPVKGAGRLDPILLGLLKVPDYRCQRLEWEAVLSQAATLAAGYLPEGGQ